MRKEKRFSLPARILGGVCALGLIGALTVFAIAGLGMVSGVVLAASLTGLAVPCVLAGGSVLEMLGALFELLAEGVTTILEAIMDAFASIFG